MWLLNVHPSRLSPGPVAPFRFCCFPLAECSSSNSFTKWIHRLFTYPGPYSAPSRTTFWFLAFKEGFSASVCVVMLFHQQRVFMKFHFLSCGHAARNWWLDHLFSNFIENLWKENLKKVWCWAWIQAWGIFKWKLKKQSGSGASARLKRFGMDNLSKRYSIHNLWKHLRVDR